MKNKHWSSALPALLLLTAVACTAAHEKADTAAPARQTAEKTHTNGVTYTGIRDLALIYQGGTHRLDWTRAELAPYVFHRQNGNFQWLFDGFLFIEFRDNLGHEYAEGYGQQPADKAAWDWLLDRNFESGKALHALDDLLDSLATAQHKPVRKRKVVLTLPEPIGSLSNWGTINNRTLNFANAADRVAACKWYMDNARQRWAAANFKHIQLEGFYWVAEQNTGAVEILPDVASLIHNAGQRFIWIPYYGAAGADKWKQMGFDIAYQQPNYFFDTNTPYHILTGAIQFAKNNNMALEMEFDNRLIADTAYRSRFKAYVYEFARAGAWDKLPIAYYEGGGAWLQMRYSTDTAVQTLYNNLAGIIAIRQQKADQE